jgi:hypothetical protein
MDGENINQIRRCWHKSHQQAEADETRGYDGSHELNLSLYSPTVHEQAGWHDEAAYCHHIQAMLGLKVAFRDVLCGCLVAKVCADQLAGE